MLEIIWLTGGFMAAFSIMIFSYSVGLTKGYNKGVQKAIEYLNTEWEKDLENYRKKKSEKDEK